jgi:P4 family phage/plasmid primase-like protien
MNGELDIKAAVDEKIRQELLDNLTVETAINFLNRNEEGDSELYCIFNRGKFVYDSLAALWFGFNCHRYYPDNNAHRLDGVDPVGDFYERGLALVTAERISTAKDGGSDALVKTAKSFVDRIRVLKSLKRRKTIVEWAQGGEERLALQETWDADPLLLGVKNGVVNLRDGALRPGRPQDFIAHSSPIPFDPAATCPRFERFIYEICCGDAGYVAYLQKVLSMALLGQKKHHVFLFIFGHGRNGKTVLVNILLFIVGDYGVKLRSEAVLSQKYGSSSHDADISILQGRRLAIVAELEEGKRFHTSRLKELTGGDMIYAREVYAKSALQFHQNALICVLSNKKPSVPAGDSAFWSRILTLPFNAVFSETPVNDELPIDRDLEEKLKAEAPGILGWLVAGCRKYLEEGIHPMPDVVRRATEDYQQEEESEITDFINNRIVGAEGNRLRGMDIYGAYKAWAEEENLRWISSKSFLRELKRQFKYETTSYLYFIDIALREDETPVPF